MTENLLNFEDFISPSIRVIIKNKLEVITNRIFPRNTIFKNILLSEGLTPEAHYTFMNNPIDLNKPIIDLIPKYRDIVTELELIIEANILDLDSNDSKHNDSRYFKILRPFEKPFRILSFSPQENNISIKKFSYQTLTFFGLENFSCSKSSYCNSPYDLYISGGGGSPDDEGEGKNFLKINNIKTTIEKLDDLPLEKQYHSMIFIPRKYIYFIGGNNRGTFYYDFISKTFKFWAPLKSIKKYPALILVNNYSIFAFGKQKNLTDKDFIEKTNIKSSPKWEIINVKISEPFNLRRFGAVLSNDDKIFFVGGRKEKDDKVFYYDIKNNEIDKTNQINSAIKINESNFYKLNEFSSVLIPQETKGDIRIIIFNRRTKKFRKARYEKDYDVISHNELFESDNFLNENEVQIKPEINFKKIENKYENEYKVKEEELKMPSLLDIKKILLGKKNILNKNVEAMVFNRKRIKNKKSDNIDGEESEKEYEEDEVNNEKEEIEFDDFNNNDEVENYEKSINISLRRRPDKNNNKVINQTLKQLFGSDENSRIFLNVKNPKIIIDDYNFNYNFLNKLKLSTIKPRGTNTNNFFGTNTGINIDGNIPFETVNSNKSIFDIDGQNLNSKVNIKIDDNMPNKGGIINNQNYNKDYSMNLNNIK